MLADVTQQDGMSGCVDPLGGCRRVITQIIPARRHWLEAPGPAVRLLDSWRCGNVWEKIRWFISCRKSPGFFGEMANVIPSDTVFNHVPGWSIVLGLPHNNNINNVIINLIIFLTCVTLARIPLSTFYQLSGLSNLSAISQQIHFWCFYMSNWSRKQWQSFVERYTLQGACKKGKGPKLCFLQYVNTLFLQLPSFSFPSPPRLSFSTSLPPQT